MPFCRARLSAKLQRRRRRKRPVAVADRCAKQGRPSGSAAFLKLAYDPLGDAAHCVNRADHLLLADNDIVEQAFELRRHPRIDQGWVGLFENTEQRQAGPGILHCLDQSAFVVTRRWPGLLVATVRLLPWGRASSKTGDQPQAKQLVSWANAPMTDGIQSLPVMRAPCSCRDEFP
jgi:hypothetical protein